MFPHIPCLKGGSTWKELARHYKSPFITPHPGGPPITGEKKKTHTLPDSDFSPFIFQTSTKAPKPVRQPSLDLPTTSMMVASTKSLWETGEVAAQSAVKSPSCKVRHPQDLPVQGKRGWPPGTNCVMLVLACWYGSLAVPTSSKGIYVRDAIFFVSVQGFGPQTFASSVLGS